MKRYWLETYGCQMNKAESNALEEGLAAKGYQPAETAEQAELFILNTCAVRKSAENRIWGRIGFLKEIKKRRNGVLVLAGCMAERLKEDIYKEAPAVDVVVGTFSKLDFLDQLDDIKPHSHSNDFTVDQEFTFSMNHLEEGSFKTMIPIMHGCNNFCSYCIVPYVRGREISRSPESILEEIRTMEQKGVKEITLLGQNVNSYQYESQEYGALNFPKLLKLIGTQLKSIEWVRFVSSHPKDFPDELIAVLAENPVFCSHIHLPVQHGSNRILAKMNRNYTREFYIDIIKKLKAKIPDVSLSTDLMVGFPGETERDFEDLMDLVQKIGFDESFTYIYNEREGTKAFDFNPKVPEEVKKERIAKLIDLQRNLSQDHKNRRIGQTVKVLVESVNKKNQAQLLARTEFNSMVILEGPKNLVGQFVNVSLDSLNGGTFIGTIVD